MEYPRRELAQGDSTKIFEIKAPDEVDFSDGFSASIVVKSKLGVEEPTLLEKAMTVEPKKIFGALEPDETTELPTGELYITVQVVNLDKTPKFTREKTYMFTIHPQGA